VLTNATQDAVTQDEAFRILRSNLEIMLMDLEPPTVIVTSAYEGEGKTSVCVNLAVALARSGRRVLLVDLDLRHPNTHKLLRAHNGKGVTDILLDRAPLADCLQFVELGGSSSRRNAGLYLLPTGPSVPDPSELLGTTRMDSLLDSLGRQADIVLLDTPPVLPVADTLVIGRMAAGAVLVVESGRTPAVAVQRAKDALTRNQTRLLGIVLNKLDAKASNFSYGYGYAPVAGPGHDE
jgi:capsular exopolysaccharide synthesis family protein